jgi:hypothetical protein
MSPDGFEWTDVAGAKPIDTLVDIAFGKGVFVGVGLHGLRMHTADGREWSEPERGAEGEHLNTVLFTGDAFVAIGAGATFRSTDGKAWERHANKNAPTAAVYGDGKFVGSLWKGKIVVSTDGIEWREVFKAPEHVEALAFGKP